MSVAQAIRQLQGRPGPASRPLDMRSIEARTAYAYRKVRELLERQAAELDSTLSPDCVERLFHEAANETCQVSLALHKDDNGTEHIVGLSVCYEGVSLAGSLSYIEDMVVTNDPEIKGVGTILLSGILADARREAVNSIGFVHDINNNGVRSLFKLGDQEKDIFSYQIPEGALKFAADVPDTLSASLTFSRAKDEDTSYIERMITQARNFNPALTNGHFSRSYLNKLIANQDRFFPVVTKNALGEVVGFSVFYRGFSTFKGTPSLHWGAAFYTDTSNFLNNMSQVIATAVQAANIGSHPQIYIPHKLVPAQFHDKFVIKLAELGGERLTYGSEGTNTHQMCGPLLPDEAITALSRANASRIAEHSAGKMRWLDLTAYTRGSNFTPS